MEGWIGTRYGPLHAHIEGDGPAILLIHGAHPDNNGLVWKHNVEAFVATGHTVYALDMLGYGHSSGELLDHRRQSEALRDLLDAEGLAEATLCGVSWGGIVALETALTRSEQVERLILVDSAGVGHYSEKDVARIACPTLVVWGEDDTVIPVANAAWFGATIPDCRVEVIPDVTAQEGVPAWGGHHPMRFRPDEFNKIVTGFLTGAG